MIKYFSIENFCSIKEKIEISFEASKIDDETSYYNYFPYKNSNIHKVLAFYGMNASGKSTIVKALAALQRLVAPGNVLPYMPFEFDPISKTSPIKMSIEFAFNNNENSPIYKYYVSYNNKFILEEKFEKMTSQKPSLLYERVTENGFVDIKIGSIAQDLALLEVMKRTVLPNVTFLSMFQNFKIEDFYQGYMFFAERFVNISPEVTRMDDLIPTSKILHDENFRNFALSLLKAADFDIDKLVVNKAKMRSVYAGIPGVITEKDSLFFVHKGDVSSGSIEFINESLGTKKITVLAEQLYPVLAKSSVMVIDELESSLHPELTRLIVKCFLDESINPKNSQLIFTSHETSLLDLGLLRRDEINFVYKDEHDCSTYIRSLKDFHPRKSENVGKSYIAGRYMTSPEVKDYFLSKEGAN